MTTALLSVADASASTTALSQLTITKSGSVTRQVTLECNPTGGTHPTSDAACAKLTAVNGDFGLLQRVPGVACISVYLPVTVTVSGHWQFRPVSYTKTYSNDCEAGVGSANVFQF